MITYILNVWIDKGEFQFKVTSNIIVPLICGCIIGVSLFLLDKKKK